VREAEVLQAAALLVLAQEIGLAYETMQHVSSMTFRHAKVKTNIADIPEARPVKPRDVCDSDIKLNCYGIGGFIESIY
jgi:hypothetical protein